VTAPRRRIVFVGEGPNDVGRRNPSSAITDDDLANGFAQALLRKILVERGVEEGDFESVVLYISGIRPPKSRQFRRPDSPSDGNRVVRKLRAAIELANSTYRAMALVFIVDDATEDARHAKALDAFLKTASDLPLIVVAATAVQELEACFFAAPDACDAAFPGFRPKSAKSPEVMKHPKEAFEQEFKAYQEAQPSRKALGVTVDEAKYEIFPRISSADLKERCQVGLGRFAALLDGGIVAAFKG